jgi:hypothetical protein
LSACVWRELSAGAARKHGDKGEGRYQYQSFHLVGFHFLFVLGGTATSRLRLLRRPFIEDGAHSLPKEPQAESVLLCKLSDLFFSIWLVCRPDALQVLVANLAVLPFAMHLSFDLFR